MPAGAAGHDADVLKLAELLFGEAHFIQKNFPGILRNASEQCVADGARLLEDFFLHEMLVAALFGHDGIPRDMVRYPLDGLAVVIHYANSIPGEYRDIAILKEKHIARMLQQRRNIAGHEIFSVAQANHRWRPKSCGYNFVWLVRG